MACHGILCFVVSLPPTILALEVGRVPQEDGEGPGLGGGGAGPEVGGGA